MSVLPHPDMAMIEISPTAQNHFRRLLENQGGDALGIRLYAMNGGTPAGDGSLHVTCGGYERGEPPGPQR